MEFLIGSAIATAFVTWLAAKFIVARSPQASSASQVTRAALAFPALSVVLFVIATVVTLAGDTTGERGTAGMVVFAMVFFLFYALFVAAVVGIPTAILAVRSLRRG